MVVTAFNSNFVHPWEWWNASNTIIVFGIRRALRKYAAILEAFQPLQIAKLGSLHVYLIMKQPAAS